MLQFLLQNKHIRNATRPLLIATIAINVFFLAMPLYMWNIYDRVLISKSVDTLLLLTAITLLILSVGHYLEVLRARLLARYGILYEKDLLEEMRPAVIDAALTGKAASTIFSHIERSSGIFKKQTMPALFDCLFVPVFILSFFLMSPLLGFIVVITSVFIVGCVYFVHVSSRNSEIMIQRSRYDVAKLRASAQRLLETALANGFMARLMGTISSAEKLDQIRNLELADKTKALTQISKFSSLIATIAISAIVTLMIITEQATVGLLFASNILLQRVLQPLSTVAGAIDEITEARNASTFLQKLNKAPRKEEGYIAECVRQVVLEDVSYRTQAGSTLFNSLNLEVTQGQIVVLTGASGVGKSTLLKIIIGVLEPSRGQVLINNFNSFHLPEDARANIGFLSQTPLFAPMSIEDNIGRLNIDDGEVIKASKLIGAHDDILLLSETYKTEFDESNKLSGGQLQKIAIARAIYRQPSMLVFDEPTTYLDDQTVDLFARLIVRFKETGRIIIIASHDPRMIQIASHLYELKKGTLIPRTAQKMKQVV